MLCASLVVSSAVSNEADETEKANKTFIKQARVNEIIIISGPEHVNHDVDFLSWVLLLRPMGGSAEELEQFILIFEGKVSRKTLCFLKQFSHERAR
jgi:hypothetical protein